MVRTVASTGATEPGPNATEFRVARWLPVEVTTLEAFRTRESVDTLDFVKAMSRVRSWKVLRGGMDTLIRHRPRLQLEIQPTHIAKYGACAHDVVNLLVDLDYTMPARRDGA